MPTPLIGTNRNLTTKRETMQRAVTKGIILGLGASLISVVANKYIPQVKEV